MWGNGFSILFLILGLSWGARAQSCTANCEGGDMVVDLEAACMCLNGNNCFHIAIGKDGPTMTTSGNGTIGDANGAKYKTTSGPGTTSYDRDALAMGIPGNDKVGKWIHKTSGCGPVSGKENARQTLGCIAVPCDKWPEVKQMKGKKISVCHGNNNDAGSYKDSDRYSGESNDVYDGDRD